MKKPLLILISGALGVGKSTLADSLNRSLSASVWLEGDDLWRMDPFIVNDATKQMVLKNIGFVLSSFLNSQFQHVIFSWVMHKKSIIEQILASLDTNSYHLIHINLACNERELLRRIAKSPTKRDPQLALARLATSWAEYPNSLNTSAMSPVQVLEFIETQIHGIPV
ncbi:MAG: AAA family ATPase [Candidatus Cloacimonetes bacterium]|nr:AAA family ATPase [Candidatus Cloacimonadota bacterium]